MRPSLASALRAGWVVAAASGLFACAGPLYAPSSAPSTLAPAAPPGGTPTPAAAAPPVPAAPIKVALLVPETGAFSAVSPSLVNAAQLALADPKGPTLDVRDTASTAAGAAAAAAAATAAGDQLILGPLTSPEAAAVAPIAAKAGVPVLAFTSDPTVAGADLWALGISPAAQVARLIPAAHDQDMRMHLAALLPQNAYGDQLLAALGQAATAAGFSTPDVARYDSDFGSINQAVRMLADYADRRGPLDDQIRAARALMTPAGRKQAAELAKQPIPPPSFDLLFIGASGQELNEVESLLPYYDITPDQVRFLGPKEWVFAAGLGLPAIAGGWYAAPDPAARSQFAQAYMEKYSVQPPAVADLAYDAASLARVLADGAGISVATLTAAAGFSGVDGVFALQPGGQVTRALGVFEVKSAGTPVLVQGAPSTLPAAAGGAGG